MNASNVALRTKDMLALLYQGSPAEQIARAEAIVIWLEKKPELSEPLYGLLPQLRQEAEILASQMRDLGMGDACSACAAKSFGGCCSTCMAANCDVVLMVLNRLLGIELSLHNHAAQGHDACCFLAASGCIFPVKPIFCLNYYCGHLKERTAPADMQKLEAQASRVLGLQCAFEERLLQILRHDADAADVLCVV